jgi:protein-disulfide isomerase
VTLARAFQGLFVAAALALVASAAFADPPPAHEPDDMAIGSPQARVTVIEYASVGCPHCAAWNNAVFPDFKAKYIDTGRVRFVVREMLTGVPAIATAGFMLARCAGPAKYFQVVDAIYRRQADMFQPGAAPGQILEDIAKSAGLDEAAFQACIDDQKGLDALNARVQRHANDDKVDSTPIFFVNGRRYVGEQTLAQLATAIHVARYGH